MLGEPRIERGFGGSVYKFLKALSAKSPAQRYKEYLASVKKRSIEGDFKSLAPELGAVSAGGILINRKMKKILEEGNEQQKERLLEEFIEGLDKDPFYEKYPDLKDKAIEKYTERMFGEKRADGGRIGFADGGMSRRTFLKIMAALASFPVVGKLAKTMKVAKGAKPIITPTAEMPAHFPKLVEKILKEGKIVSAEKSGFIKKYQHPTRKDIEMEVQGDGDQISVTFETDQGAPGYYEYRKGDIIEEGKFRGQRETAEFKEAEELGKMNPDGDVDTDINEFIDTGTENLDKFVGMPKQSTSKSKIILQDPEYSKGGVAGLLGE